MCSSALFYFMQPCLLSSTLWLHPLSIYDEQFILFWLGTQWEKRWFFNKGGIRFFGSTIITNFIFWGYNSALTPNTKWEQTPFKLSTSAQNWQKLELISTESMLNRIWVEKQLFHWNNTSKYFEARSNKLNRNDEEIPGSKSSEWVQIAAKWPSSKISDQSNDQRKVVWPTAMCADVSSWQFSDQQQVVWSKLVLLHTALKKL